MARKILDPEVEKVLKTANMAQAHQSKTYNYKIEDFIIEKNKWRHKDWKCWMQGTRQTVKNYIKECCKPYELRNLDGFHSASDE